MTYEAFIDGKARSTAFDGIKPATLAPHLFDHQRDLTRWALAKGRAAVFADTGLGKTAIELEWARHVSERGRVLILAPLAVAAQVVAEGARFGVDARLARRDDGSRIVVANYESMEHFDPAAFTGVVLDESSILKAFDGRTRTRLIESFRETPYRLAATATPAPNDFTELGNHSEFLGIRTRAEMLAEFFVHDMDTTQEWRLKGHAVTAFWKWVATWGAVVRSPADLGYDDSAYRLPPLQMHEHVIAVDTADAWRAGQLFATNAVTLSDQRATRRATLEKRAKQTAAIASMPGPCVVWVELNDEADAVVAGIPDAVEVRGNEEPEAKVEKLVAFAEGRIRVIVTKSSIAGFGLNWQHCARMVFVGASHSYEQTYQAIRRCWRFGQRSVVDVHIIRADTEQLVVDNYRRKEADAARLAAEMSAQVYDAVRAEVQGATGREHNPYHPSTPITVPSWLSEVTT